MDYDKIKIIVKLYLFLLIQKNYYKQGKFMFQP